MHFQNNIYSPGFSANDDPVLDDEIARLAMIPRIANRTPTFAEAYFSKVPPVASLTILRKFENDIYVLERKVLENILKDNNVTER